MKISDLLIRLEQIKSINGDVDVFVNGEYGSEDIKKCDNDYLSLCFGTDYEDLDTDERILIIGGY